METRSPTIVLITGQAGAGHSTALKILEDEGFVTVDNLPLALVDQLVAIEVETEGHDLAFCVDARTSGFDVTGLLRLVENLHKKFGSEAKVVHLSASRAEITRRYQSTRRHHPLAKDNVLEEAILTDQERMAQIKPHADVLIDSTAISPNALREALLQGVDMSPAENMAVRVVSFAFKQGIPTNSDYVFDVRFLRNPHWEPELRAMSGKEDKVADYIQSDEGFDMFLSHLTGMSAPIIERALKDGRALLTFSFGCTGGKHRSVASAIAFEKWLTRQGYKTELLHRELDSHTND
ncbi:MAG: RNase adapter RapZ [Candidatus Puniceispirillaceae bacterium]